MSFCRLSDFFFADILITSSKCRCIEKRGSEGGMDIIFKIHKSHQCHFYSKTLCCYLAGNFISNVFMWTCFMLLYS